ncbi:glycosyltransferase [Mucilaginibacter sp. HD30]
MEKGVSVVVCCFNGADRLPQTIKHLALQRVPPWVKWEIVIIDNASTDNTAQLAISEWACHRMQDVPFRVIAEPAAGLRYAREKGLLSAAYEYLIFCDDDNWLSDQYVATVYEIMSADDKIGVLGGCGIFKPQEPVWADAEKYKSCYVNGSQTWASTQHWVYGAAATYRKSALTQFYKDGWQPIAVGRAGNTMGAAEDVEICFMFFLNGYKIEADDRLQFDHFVPTARQNINYLLKLEYGIGYSYVLLSNYLAIIEQDERTIKQKLRDWLIFALKKRARLFYQITKQKILKGEPALLKQRLDLQSCRGTIASLVQNKKRIIEHAAMLKRILGVHAG